MATPPTAADRRRSRTDYLDAGLHLLADGGEQALTIANLCDRLGVTKGSFYHHFSGGGDFRSRLLEDWAVTRSDELRARVEAEPDPRSRIELLKEVAIGLEHEAESAIRAWSRTDPEAAAAQRRVDDEREQALVVAFAEIGVPVEHAAVLARVGVTILVGTQQLEERVDRARLATLFDEYQRWIVAAAPAVR